MEGRWPMSVANVQPLEEEVLACFARARRQASGGVACVRACICVCMCVLMLTSLHSCGIFGAVAYIAFTHTLGGIVLSFVFKQGSRQPEWPMSFPGGEKCVWDIIQDVEDLSTSRGHMRRTGRPCLRHTSGRVPPQPARW